VLNRAIFDDRGTTENRGVRALHFSAFYPELVAAAYDRNFESHHSPEGVVHTWNCNFKTLPE
jgi:hypothetical protein